MKDVRSTDVSCAELAHALSLAEHRADKAGVVKFRNTRSELEIWLILISLLSQYSKGRIKTRLLRFVNNKNSWDQWRDRIDCYASLRT